MPDHGPAWSQWTRPWLSPGDEHSLGSSVPQSPPRPIVPRPAHFARLLHLSEPFGHLSLQQFKFGEFRHEEGWNYRAENQDPEARRGLTLDLGEGACLAQGELLSAPFRSHTDLHGGGDQPSVL